jgi:oligoendopeptidase F
VGSRFSIWLGPGSERELAWAQPIQFYTRPLYRVNYVIAKLLALRYLDLLHQDPSGFRARYAALLRNGYDAPPTTMLKRFLDIDFADSKALVGSASKVLDEWARGTATVPSVR